MNTDIQTLLRATTPDAPPEVDVAALRRRGARRRAVKRTASVLSVALVLAGAAVPVVMNRQAPVRFADEGGAVVWEELNLQQAVARLRETAREKAGLPPAEDAEIRVVGVVGRAVSDDEGTREWLAPFEVRVRHAKESWRSVYDRWEDRIARGTSVEEVRRILSELPPPDDDPKPVDKSPEANPKPFPTSAAYGPYAVDGVIDEAEELATKPDPYEPAPGETERPERAYAFVRLMDALREKPLEADVLDRGYGVIASLGEQWVRYDGLVEDLLGREAVAFTAFDPANDTDMTLLFDPDTGRVWGEFDFLRTPAGLELLGGNAVEYLGW